nr:transposase (putative), gypsy type [Tanacetum cinerariifolium]
MSFNKRSDTAPVCYTKPLDSLKHWNDSFLWVDASVFPLFVLWHTKKILVRNHPPTAAEFSAKACDFLATHQASFWKFLEPFLCLVDLSRYYEFDDDVYLTFLTDAGEEMDLFSFIRHADPTKVQIGKRQIEEGYVPLLESTEGRVIPLAGRNDHGGQNDNVEVAGSHKLNEEGSGVEVGNRSKKSDCVIQDEEVNIVADEGVQAAVADKPKKTRKKRKAVGGASGSNLPPKKLKEYHGTSSDAGASTAGKYLVALQGLLEQSTLAVEIGATVAETMPFVTSSVTLTPHNLQTQHPAKRFVISSESSHHSSTNAADVEVTFISRFSISPSPVMTAAVAATAVAGISFAPIYVPKWNVINDFALNDRRVARQACFSAEVRLRSKRNYRERKKFKRKCDRQTDLLKEKDIEIANLKAQLSLKEAEGTEAIHLRNQVSVAEAAEATRVSELNSLKEQNSILEEEKGVLDWEFVTLESAGVAKETGLASLTTYTAKLTQDLSSLQLSFDELSINASSLESQRGGLIDQVSSLETACSEFSPRFLTIIARRRWIISHGFKLAVMKCLRSPKYVATLGMAIGLAIDKGMQTDLVAGTNHGKVRRGLAEVAAYDPSVEKSIVDIMNFLCLEGPSAKTPEVIRLQPVYEQLLLPIHRKEDNFVIGETSLSDSLTIVHDHFQKVKKGVLSHHLSISEAMGPLVDPLSSKKLIGEASTSGVPTAATTTTLSTTFAHSVPPISVTDYDVLDTKAQPEASYSPKIIFEQETLETSSEHPTTS